MPERIVLTSTQKQFIRDNWGKISTQNMAERLGCSRTYISYSARQMKLPNLKASATSPLWTAEDIAIMRQCIAADMPNADIQREHFPHRTRDAVKEKRKRLNSGVPLRMERPNRRITAGKKPSNLPKVKAETFNEKTPTFPPLQYTISECPRVTLEYACHWMKQQRRGWERPDDDREAWRAINAERVNGMFPVPPFLPIKPLHMHDTHRIPAMERVSQSLGLR